MLQYAKTDNQYKLAKRKHEAITKTIVKNRESMIMHIQSQNAKKQGSKHTKNYARWV